MTGLTPHIRRMQFAVVALLMLGGIVNYIDRSALAVANVPIRQELGLNATSIRAAMQGQRGPMQALFDQLRQDGADEPGVSRDPYGDGEQRAHATVTKARRISAGEFENTLSFSFTVGDHSFSFLPDFCTRDVVGKDGLGLPGYHDCGASRIPSDQYYLG